MSDRRERHAYFVDKKVQGALLVRAARYWVLSLVVVGALTILGWMFVSPGMPVLVEIRDQLPSLLGGGRGSASRVARRFAGDSLRFGADVESVCRPDAAFTTRHGASSCRGACRSDPFS